MSESENRWTFNPANFAPDDGARFSINLGPMPEFTDEQKREDVIGDLLWWADDAQIRRWREDPAAFEAAVAEGLANWKPPWERFGEFLARGGMEAWRWDRKPLLEVLMSDEEDVRDED